jgi:hypothetical protein
MISKTEKKHGRIIPIAIWLGGILAIAVVAVLVFPRGKAGKFVSQRAAQDKTQNEAVLEAGSVVTIRANYNNPGEESVVIKIEEAVPEGADYIKGTARIDGKLLTDTKDGDQGYFDETANTLFWEAGSVPPGAGGDVSYQARVTGAKTEMKSVTKFILDPGTEDEEELAGEPFIFSLGKPFPR